MPPSPIPLLHAPLWGGMTALVLQAVLIPPVQAQTVTADPSLGTRVSSGSDGVSISGGAIRGNNLFHSFDTFSPEAASVLFDLTEPSYGTASQTIERIFSRVTGSEASRINGPLAIQGGNTPDLFLLNPHGIVFGPNAQLQLAGSFLGSTAEAIQFADASVFPAALNPNEQQPLLSLSAPVGLQMGQRSGRIEVQGTGNKQLAVGLLSRASESQQQPSEAVGLRVSEGKTLALVGGEIAIAGGILQGTPSIDPDSGLPRGGIQLALGAVADGNIRLQPSAYGFELNYDNIAEYGDIRLGNRSLVEVTGTQPSQGEIRGKNITIEDASIVALINLGNQANSGRLTVKASEDLAILSRNPATPFTSGILNRTLGSGRGADINITANNLLLEGGVIVNSTLGAQGGRAGDINISVEQDIQLQAAAIALELASSASSSAISSSSLGMGNGGIIDIKAKKLTLENGGIILSSALGLPGNSQAPGSGNGGEIQIQVQDATTIRGFDSRLFLPSGINSSTVTTGNAGSINLTTKQLNIEGGGSIQGDSFSRGNAGDITIQATDSIRLSGTSENAVGLSSSISSSVTTDIVRGLAEEFELPERPQGDGGNIAITTSTLALNDRARLSVFNQGSGEVGQLDIEAINIFLNGQAELTATSETEVGELNPREAASPAEGIRNFLDFNIALSASDSLFLSGGSKINASALGIRNGGNISIGANRIFLRNGSEINASSLGARDGGNIAIETGRLIAVPRENSDISANAVSRSGGRIQLNAASVLGIKVQPQPTEKSDITASSNLGTQGSVELTQTQTKPSRRLKALPSKLADQSDRLSQSCDAGSSQFSITGRGSLPQASHATQMLSQQYGDRGHHYERAQQWQQADYHYRKALQLSQSAQNHFQSYQWAWQLGRIAKARWQSTGEEQFREDAIIYYQESLSTLKALRSDLAKQDQDAEFSFRSSIEPVYRELVSLLLDEGHSHTPNQENLKASLEVIEALRLAELDDFFEDACSTVTAKSVEQLDPTAAVVYPILLGDRLEVIMSLPDGTMHRHRSSISPAQVDQLTQRFHEELLIRSRKNYREPGEQLYRLLIQPALAKLQQAEIETLVFVPDGSLKNIPIAAVWSGEAHLIEQFNVAVAPGLKLLDAQPSQKVGTGAIAAGVSQARESFAPLDYVPQELADIQVQISGETLLDEAFTGEGLRRSLLANQAPIVHIATHGQFGSTTEDTFILAWDERIDAAQLGALLRSREREQSPTELLVLSACETAVGDERAALGLAGLAVRAGARSTLASLWSINDASTALLMQAFYNGLSREASSKSAALRQAQLAMLADEAYSHPYYWSAFVLLGNWQ